MSAPSSPLRTVALLAVAGGLAGWGGFGLFQGLHSGFSGGLYDTRYRVPGVQPGGPAAKAGFQAGDRVIAVQGRPIEHLGMESRWPRSLAPQVGQAHAFTVERNGERRTIDYVYGPPSQAAIANRYQSAITGLGFLCFCLWAGLTLHTPASRALLPVGLAAGVATAAGLGPNLGTWNGVQGHIATAAATLLFLLILRFFALYPQPKAVAGSRIARWLVYGPWAGLAAFLGAELLTHPLLYYTTGSVAFPLALLYALLTLVAIGHTLARYPPAELRKSGMFWILAGLLGALAAALLLSLLSADLPAWAAAVPVLLIPFTMALAARTQQRSIHA